MTKTAFLCSGQGAQKVGMGIDFALNSPDIADLFALAGSTTGIGVYEMCMNGPEEELSQTHNTQPCLVTTSIAISMAVRQRGIEPDCVAGFSLGEYAAHVIAGSLDAETALELVGRRGAVMAMAAKKNPGGMAALLKCTPEQAQELCGKYAAETGKVLAVGNINCPGQVVISGADEPLAAAMEAWKSQGGRCTKLATSGAFHSPLMESAAQMMRPALNGTLFGVDEVPLYCNLTGERVDFRKAHEVLVDQITHPVLWQKTIENMMDDGVDRFVECGPGKVLAGMVKRIARAREAEVSIISIGAYEDLEKLNG